MKTSIEENNIAQPYGYFINYKNKDAYVLPQFKDNYYMIYRANITYNKERNKAGIEMLKFLNKYNIKTLASFNNIKPGQARMKELKQEGIKSLFICGDETIYEWVNGPRGGLKLEKRKGDTETIKKAMAEDGKVSIRNIRHDALEDLEVLELPEDEEKSKSAAIQNLVNEYNKIIDEKLKEKNEELLTV